MVTLTWHASKYKVQKLHQRYILNVPDAEDVPLAEFIYLVFTCLPVSYHPWLRPLLFCLRDIF